MREIEREIYAKPGGAAGCCLHIVTDDGNYGDSALAVCRAAALKAKHALCAWLVEAYQATPRRERCRVWRRRKTVSASVS